MQQENDTNDIPVEVTKPNYWQWIKGELIGNVVTVKDTNDSYINFNEGGRLAIGLRDEFLQPLDDDVAGEFIGPNTPGPDPLGVSSNLVVIDSLNTEAILKTKSPIRILFDKQKNNNKVKLVLEFPVNIPPKGMYDLMSASFDTSEVKAELESFILDQLSKDNITECLNQSVVSLIENKYKDE